MLNIVKEKGKREKHIECALTDSMITVVQVARVLNKSGLAFG